MLKDVWTMQWILVCQVQIPASPPVFTFMQILLRQAWICLFSASHLWVKQHGTLSSLALNSNQSQRRKISEFQSMEKVLGNHSTICPKNTQQFVDNKQMESVECHDCQHSERTRNLTKTLMYSQKMFSNHFIELFKILTSRWLKYQRTN